MPSVHLCTWLVVFSLQQIDWSINTVLNAGGREVRWCATASSSALIKMFNPIRPVLSSSQEYSQELERRMTTTSQWRWGQHQRQRMVVWSECGEDRCNVHHYQPEEQKTLVGRWETIWLSHPRFTPVFLPVILNHMLSAQCSFTHTYWDVTITYLFLLQKWT